MALFRNLELQSAYKEERVAGHWFRRTGRAVDRGEGFGEDADLESSRGRGLVVIPVLHADMLAYQSGYRAFAELGMLPELFPFELSLSKERLVEDARFLVGNFGREFTVPLREG